MHISLSKKTILKLLKAFFLILLLGSQQVYAQVQPDTLRSAETDTIPPVMEGGVPQVPQTRQSERQASPDAVNFQARDSLTFNFRNQRVGHLYGSANVTHTNGQLDAGMIELDLNLDQVEAGTTTPEDTLSYPVLRQNDQDLRSTRILFNYRTERGKFEVAEIQVPDGYLIGTQVKNVSREEVFIEDGIYSTCPPDHMYYYIKARRMKVVDQEEIFFTNAQLFILDIPYPLIFPFGYVPAGIESRQSGILEPTYAFQNTSTRGIGLQNLGWFQYFNDYFVGQTSFDVFTSGTFFNETRFQYRKTGSFNGSIGFGYSSERGLEPSDPNFSERTTRRVNVTHDQQISPYANLSANIDLRTADYFQRNSFDPDERAETSSSSRISYRYSHPENTYNFSVSSRLNQQFNTNTTRLVGPEANFSLRQISPFKRDEPGLTEERWYERISIGYRNNFRSEYSFSPIDGDTATVNWFEALLDPSLYREATGNDDHLDFGFEQRVQLSAGQIIPSQYINISASANYTEFWYPSTIRRRFIEDENEVETFRVRGFAATRDFSTSLNFSTTFYGISQIKIGKFEGLRHTLRPNLSFSYRPDFSEDFWGAYREVQTDTLGNTRQYSIFEGTVFGGPSSGEQRTMSFGLTNILETKQVKRDSTGEVQSTNLRLIDNLSINSGYNFAADSLNFSQVNVSLSSRVLDGIRFQASANYTLYARDENGRQLNTFIWNASNKFLQPQNYNLSLSTSFNGGKRGVQVQTPAYRPYDPYNQGFFSPVDRRFNLDPIQPLHSTWSVGLDFSYRWTWRSGQEANESATLNVNNIQFNLTPKWRVGTRIGYEFIDKELTPSQFSLSRSMICWDLSFQFNPFGEFQYYFFRLSLSSSQISNLFQKLPLLNNLERSSSPTGRAPRF
ncbi:MAG: putative LPS assembly protein LptD [Balneolaceae bacterium]